MPFDSIRIVVIVARVQLAIGHEDDVPSDILVIGRRLQHVAREDAVFGAQACAPQQAYVVVRTPIGCKIGRVGLEVRQVGIFGEQLALVRAAGLRR